MTAGVTRGSLKKIKDETEYYPHQLEGIRKMALMGSFILADEMGLGKSLQALTVSAIHVEMNVAKKILIVCPASLKWNWEDEILKFTRFTCQLLHGSKSKREAQLNLFTGFDLDILIVNYEQVVSHLNDLNEIGFDIIIYDEAHMLKSRKSQRTTACMKLNAKFHFVLTGSPMLNQPDELWTLLHRIRPREYAYFSHFRNKYCLLGGYTGKSVIGALNKDELNAELRSVMVRRLKGDVISLPPKVHIDIKVHLTDLQQKLYDQAVEELRLTVPDQPDPLELENALVKYMRLNQIMGTTASLGYPDESAKLDAVESLVNSIVFNRSGTAEPVVIFTGHRAVWECTQARLEKMKVTCFMITGDTPKELRAEIIKQWANYQDAAGNRAALICSLKAAGVGLNMTAANKCIFIDRLYVPKLNEQAEDRLHRIGVKGASVTIYNIIAQKTLDQRISSILTRKEKLFNSVIEESDWKRRLFASLREKDED